MSYDIVFWRASPSVDPDEIWARFREGETVEGIEPLAPAAIVRAFEKTFGNRVRVSGDVLEGPGFELDLDDGAPYRQVCCTWGLLRSDEGRAILARIAQAGEALGAQVFDPQRATRPRTTRPAARGDLAQLGDGHAVSYVSPGEDRARSFANIEVFEVHGRGEPGSAQAIFLEDAGCDDADIACTYVRLVQDVLPFEVFVVYGRGRAGRTTFELSPRLLGIVDDTFGFLDAPDGPVEVLEDGAIAHVWDALEFSTTGPFAAREGEITDLTPIVEQVARDALAAAQRGHTRKLRELLVLFASFDTDGRGTEELLRGETPRAFEVFDTGAVMPIWAQFPHGGAFHVEARLKLPATGGFTIELVTTEKRAAMRHQLLKPLGPVDDAQS